MIIFESIISGIWATLIMDLFAKFLASRKLIYPFMTPQDLGRWFYYLLKGRIIHKDIRKTPPVKNEKMWYYVSHYLIGVILAGFYLTLSSIIKELDDNEWMALVFGIFTIVLPWFWLLPSTGLGFMASRSPDRINILRTNLINHTNFGLGLYLWMILFHGLL